MFGQFSLLNHQMRKSQVTAISHSVILVLDETSFRRLLKRNLALRDAVVESAERRGIRADLIDLSDDQASSRSMRH